ncbi:YdeI/OmpD-associated family protein [Membranihabitans marinus]|uniref:YdeI/OmpD-associated family protein n=1 Tax=Membranihabitans marinus TaxID=1227546 RepID=UPI001F45B988|nr:YdeI/OmpD-associated family protein [Membranihabitans marinus]
MTKKDIETFYPKSRREWRKWLEKNHQSKQSVYVIFYRVSSDIASITWSEAVDEALCFGWIDSTKKTIDEKSYMQYFSKRKLQSNWSKINKDKIKQLTEEGLMAPAGMESVKIAKENGSWTYLDDVENLVIPSDLEKALVKEVNAKEYFMNFSKSTKKSILYWIMSAKREETRKNRIEQVVKHAGKNLKPKQFR